MVEVSIIKLMFLAILSAISVAAYARMSSASCFVFSYGPFGDKSGQAFSDYSRLTGDYTTVDMRVSKVTVCTDKSTPILQGLQLYMTDVKEQFTIPMNPAGLVGDPSSKCESFSVDTSTEYLKNIEIWYNSTAVYSIALSTSKNRTATYGPVTPDLMRQLWSITENSNGPNYAVVGLAGFQKTSQKPAIASLQIIVMNLNCTSTYIRVPNLTTTPVEPLQALPQEQSNNTIVIQPSATIITLSSTETTQAASSTESQFFT
jgi:hypothetical protein